MIKYGIIFFFLYLHATAQDYKPELNYTVTFPEPEKHYFVVELSCNGWISDTIDFCLPRWMPGYYQIMDYAQYIDNVRISNSEKQSVLSYKLNSNSLRLKLNKGTAFKISYQVEANKQFVANNYVDSAHGYLVPAATFLYIKDHIQTPVTVTIVNHPNWKHIATGLELSRGTLNEFSATDFDQLYDCPFLLGNLEEFPSFSIQGVEHSFKVFNPGKFNRNEFITDLHKSIRQAIQLIGDIPYKKYTFIGIGPGRGGIEHLNNCIVSFDGNGLEQRNNRIRMLNFLSHEYFHHYNVKRIRPYELGPFNYDCENRTNLLWVSEGFTVYYEYLMVKRGGLIDETEFFNELAGNISTLENDSGRLYQSLVQSSYHTWSDGPFGNSQSGPDMAISYYEKGPVVALILDISIRRATQNQKSLDDVMRYLYWNYYKKENRGFTDAEFQQVCESIAGIPLTKEFEYAYTTKEIDYDSYLSFVGLTLSINYPTVNSSKKYVLKKSEHMNKFQKIILDSLLGN